MVAHHAQSVGIPPPVALTMMIVGRWTWGRSAYRWTKSAATMALAIRAKSLSASVMRSRRQQPEYAPVKAACSSPVWLNPLLIPTRVKADSFQGFQNGASSESCPSASATGPMHDAQCGLVSGIRGSAPADAQFFNGLAVGHFPKIPFGKRMGSRAARKSPPRRAEECSRMSRQRATTPRQHARLTELLRRCNRPSFHSRSMTLAHEPFEKIQLNSVEPGPGLASGTFY